MPSAIREWPPVNSGPALEPAVCRAAAVGPGWGPDPSCPARAPSDKLARPVASLQSPAGHLGHDPKVVGAQIGGGSRFQARGLSRAVAFTWPCRLPGTRRTEGSLPWSPGEARGPPSRQPRCPPAPRVAGGLQAGEMGFGPGVGAVEGSNPEVGPRVQEGEGACPGWELWRPELPGAPVGKILLELELWGTGRQHRRGDPRQTRPDCYRVKGERRETPLRGA